MKNSVSSLSVSSSDKQAKKKKINGAPGRAPTLADAICREDHFAQDRGGKLYRYEDGVYKPDARKHIKAKVKQLLVASKNAASDWSSRLASEVVEYIGVDASELPDRPRLDLINVENGMVRVADGVLLPHKPEYLSVVQLPVKYDPAATCPNIDRFVESTFPPDTHDLAWEVPGVLMTPMTWMQKAILLIGEGGNGKSAWLSLLVRFLGKRNTSALSLHKLEADRFSVPRLIGKLANICADLPSAHLEGTSIFKALTDGKDFVSAEYKHVDSFDILPFARLVFSANYPPRSSDSTPAFFRRWVVIPFDHTFGPDEMIPRDILDAQLQSPDELSGMLNKAIEGLCRVNKQRYFSETPSTQEALRDFRSTTDPLAVWLDKYTIDEPESFVSKQVLRDSYSAAIKRDDRPSMSEKAFSQAIGRLRPKVDSKQRTVDRKVQWCFIGLGMSTAS
jgi:putative DNA primase/helicase